MMDEIFPIDFLCMTWGVGIGYDMQITVVSRLNPRKDGKKKKDKMGCK